jgi:DNA-binding CsgD family transcriptional regulator
MSDTVTKLLDEVGVAENWKARFKEKVVAEVRETVMEQARVEALEQARAEVQEQGMEEAARRLRHYGMEPQQIAEALELSRDTVLRYLKTE